MTIVKVSILWVLFKLSVNLLVTNNKKKKNVVYVQTFTLSIRNFLYTLQAHVLVINLKGEIISALNVLNPLRFFLIHKNVIVPPSTWNTLLMSF